MTVRYLEHMISNEDDGAHRPSGKCSENVRHQEPRCVANRTLIR